jgi:hypothetical protein
MKSKRYALCVILAGGLAYGLIDLGCNDTGTPRGPFPIPDAGHVGSSSGPGPFDGGQTPDDASVFDAFNTPPPQDGGITGADGGF